MTSPSDLPVHRFPDQAAFEAWLEAEHERCPGIYVVLAKKGAPEPTLKQQEMVESLLCFGWIDGRANRLDDTWYLQRVTPRRPRSVDIGAACDSNAPMSGGLVAEHVTERVCGMCRR